MISSSNVVVVVISIIFIIYNRDIPVPDFGYRPFLANPAKFLAGFPGFATISECRLFTVKGNETSRGLSASKRYDGVMDSQWQRTEHNE